MSDVVEEAIHLIWVEELNTTSFTNDDDFFALGGHSLIMAKIQVRLEADIGVTVPMDDLFRYPTVSGITEYISRMPQAHSA